MELDPLPLPDGAQGSAVAAAEPEPTTMIGDDGPDRRRRTIRTAAAAPVPGVALYLPSFVLH